MKTTESESQRMGSGLLVWPGWFRSARANHALSMERQTRYRDAVLSLRTSFFGRVLARVPIVGELRALRIENRQLRGLLNEKTRKLADADAQVVELSSANRHLQQLAKDRRLKLREHGIAA